MGACRVRTISRAADPPRRPEQFAALIRRDSAMWAEVIKRSGAKID
jgi:hypothetical protein